MTIKYEGKGPWLCKIWKAQHLKKYIFFYLNSKKKYRKIQPYFCTAGRYTGRLNKRVMLCSKKYMLIANNREQERMRANREKVV